MSIIDDIKADREAGTGGDWRRARVGHNTISETSVEGDRFVCTAGGYSDGHPDTHLENEANARRIARVPKLEAIVLAADKVVEAALSEVDAFCVLEDSHQIATRRELEDALDQFREVSND